MDLKKYQKILFVGGHGICRSPMAAAILKEYRLNREIIIESRGMVALFPEPMNQKAESVLISNGITIENQMSVQLTEQDFTEETLVLVMEQVQREKILQDYPVVNPEDIFVLTELVGDELEIINPYGGPLQSYGICYETLNNSIKKLVDLLNAED